MRSAIPPISDADAVREQLNEAIVPIARVRRLCQKHAYGSTVAVERYVEVELESACVRIPLETELLPARTTIRIVKQGALFRTSCTLEAIHGGNAVYRVEVVP